MIVVALKDLSLNARAVASYMTVGESAQRTTLRQYAKPKAEQKAAILMYDPIRKNLRDYFGSGRDKSVLARVSDLIAKHPVENKFDDTYKRSNSRALTNLENLELPGKFSDVHRYFSTIVVAGLRVKSSVDFLTTFQGIDSRSKTKRLAVIVNPSGIRRGNPDARKRFARIEIEFALQMLGSDRVVVDECWYIDLPKESVVEKRGKTNSRLWADIDAACERIVEDFKRYRLGDVRPEEA